MVLRDVHHRDGLYYGEDRKVWKISAARVSTDSVFWDYICLANIRKIVEPEVKTQLALIIHFQSTSFILPDVEFWCSPAHLQLERGERSDSREAISPSKEGTNTTDHCLMFTGQSDNITQCSRSGKLNIF